MFLHSVIFTWKEGVGRRDVDAVTTSLDQMKGAVKGLLSLQHGPDLVLRPGNGDYLLVATFESEAAWRDYQAHPGHNKLVSEILPPLLSSCIAVQTAL